MNTKKITLDQFRAWLQGVEEMQDEGWIPTASQWAKIREKIDLIEDSPSQRNHVPPIQYAQPQLTSPAAIPSTPPTAPAVPAGPSSMGPARTPVGPAVTSQGGLLLKTPDIDTSAGSYESAFL